jgi:hypothetical protein
MKDSNWTPNPHSSSWQFPEVDAKELQPQSRKKHFEKHTILIALCSKERTKAFIQ